MGITLSSREAYIKDPTTPTTSALFAGSKQYFNTLSVSFNYRNILTYKPITKISWAITGAETAIGDETNYSRRKGIISYGGMNVLTINITGLLDKNSLGSFDVSTYEATAGKLRQMFTVPRTYRFYDAKLGSAIMFDSHASVKNPYATNSEIPVIIQDLSFSSSSDTLNEIAFNMTFLEDKS